MIWDGQLGPNVAKSSETSHLIFHDEITDEERIEYALACKVVMCSNDD